MQLAFRKLDPRAKAPTYAYAGDAGMDLYALDAATLMPGTVTPVPTGIALAIPDGHVGLIWDKSSKGSKGIHSVGGVFDAGYRGDITVHLLNTTAEPVALAAGEKAAQMLIQPVVAPTLEECQELPYGERGEKRLGSSGTH